MLTTGPARIAAGEEAHPASAPKLPKSQRTGARRALDVLACHTIFELTLRSERGESAMVSPDPSDAEPDLAALQARASTRRRGVLGAVFALLLAGGAAGVTLAKRAEKAEAAQAASSLRDCLLGGPLDPGESAVQRVRRRQLALFELSDSERTKRGMRLWPLACRDAADHALQKLADVASDQERRSLGDLVRDLSSPAAVTKDLSGTLPVVMGLLDAHFAAPVTRGKDPIPPVVPSIAGLSPAAALSRKGTALNRCYTEDNPGVTLPVLVDEEGLPAPLFCSFRADSRDAHCRLLRELAAVRGHGLRLLGTADPDAEHLVFAGRRGSEGVFVTGSPTPIDKLYSYGGYSASDGSVSVLGWDEAARGLVLVQGKKGEPGKRIALKPNFRVGNYFYGSQLLWDQVLVRGITPDNERRLYLLPLGGDDQRSFGLVDIGELPEAGLIRAGEEEQPHLTGCRTRKATVVRVRGTDSDFLTFRLNSTFTSPVEAPAFGVLGCYGTTATIVDVAYGKAGATRIFHDACTSAGCTHSEVRGQALDKDSSDLRPAEASDIAAVDLGGQLLVAWLAGERGGLRVRLAPPDRFERAPDVVLLDDHVLDGKNTDVSTVLGFRLYSRESFAVLLVSTLAGLHAFRIDPSGKVEPFHVSQAG